MSAWWRAWVVAACFGVGFVVLALFGCGDEPVAADLRCTPGETQECVGPGRCVGGQHCLKDGSGYSRCDCGPDGGANAGHGGVLDAGRPDADATNDSGSGDSGAGDPDASDAGESDASDAAAPPPPTAKLRLQFIPTKRAQIALWLEDAKGTFLSTVRLTEATARRGIGNRPGASQMNSGWHWPYGRREGVLSIWATRRASAPGAALFPRVVFQDRTSEGLASRTSPDSSRDDYFCLSFNRELSKRHKLDAVSCASVFNGDKGRYITEADITTGYSEPYEPIGMAGQGVERPLTLKSRYPARTDVSPCAGFGCFDHPDLERFKEDVRRIMPDLDAVSMATPNGNSPLEIVFDVPPSWPAGDYTAWIEVNVEGDYGPGYDPGAMPTPTTPRTLWDNWARDFGYPYRGQPSVVFHVPFVLGSERERVYGTAAPVGRGSWDLTASGFGQLQRDVSGIVDDPIGAPGSGADRLRFRPDGRRFVVTVIPPSVEAADGGTSQ